MRIDSYGDVLIGMTANDVAQENGAFIQSANGRYFCSLGSNSLKLKVLQIYTLLLLE